MICSLQSRDFASIKACVCRIIMCGIQPLDLDNSVVLLFPFTISLIHQLTDERFSQGEKAYNSVLRIIGPCPLLQTNSIQYFKVNLLYSHTLLCNHCERVWYLGNNKPKQIPESACYVYTGERSMAFFVSPVQALQLSA